MRCLLCRQQVLRNPPLDQLLSFRPLASSPLCQQCAARFRRIDERHACPDCGRQNDGEQCRDCLRWTKMGVSSLHHRGLFVYDDAMKQLIENYKGIGDYHLRRCFVAEIAGLQQLRAAFVPLTSEPAHYRERGFDPVLGLFDVLPLHLWLEKSATDKPQAKKNRAARMLTPQSFTCTCSKVHMNRYRRVCLLDDLYTTGRTLHHAAAALRAGGYAGKIVSRSLIR